MFMRFRCVSTRLLDSAVMAAICSGWRAERALFMVEAMSTCGPRADSDGSFPSWKRAAELVKPSAAEEAAPEAETEK